MFRSTPLIDVEVLAERVRIELALLEKSRGHCAAAGAQTDRTAEPPAAAAAPIKTPRSDFRARPKGLIGGIPGKAQSFWCSLLPLLIEPHRSDASPGAIFAVSRERTLLFVGPWREDNNQLTLVRAFSTLRGMCETPLRLILAGKISSTDYFNEVQAEIHSRQLDQDVLVLKNPTPEELDRLYRHADLYVSLSLRECFFSSIGSGPPPVQAMAYDLPVLAYGAKVISSLLGSGGLILETREPDVIASAAKLVLEEPWLRRQIVHAQRCEFRRLQRLSIRKKLKVTLGRHKTRTEDWRNTAAWRIEGPFDSSYSLAIVNREVALALSEQGEAVELVSRDGPGPFPPAVDFLQKNPAIAAMWQAGQTSRAPDIALRNTYPPWVSNVAGELRGIVCYAWEESGFPSDYVREFNCNLDLATVTSRYVAKVLRDNGVRAPIRVMGDGIDQIIRLDSAKHETEFVRKFGIGDRFCFLHISSGLPRKGLDVLLAAWAKAFRDADDVVLVIKASPNQHHQIEEEVAALTKADPQHAPIVVINQSIEAAEICALYRRADVVVAPSRGEGFGLPIAEALALAKPVIATAFGGQMDFCTAENAWLCDYDFAYARSHLSTPLSVWAEPRVDSLVRCLQQVRSASADERRRRGQIGRARVRANYAWKDIAYRLQRAVADVRALDASALRLPKIGWVSTWNSRCGIAAYSEALTTAIPADRLVVFATNNAELELLGADLPFVKRTWEQGWSDPLDQLYQAIDEANVDAVVFQFNFGFVALKALARLIDRLNEKGVPVYLGLHSTVDVERPDLTIRLADVASSLARARRLLVHSVHDLNRLKARGLIDNVTLLPFGLPRPPIEKRHIIGPRKLIASFGYLLAHKGLPELIEAISMLRRDGLDVDLLLLNALYPVEESQRMQAVCENAIHQCGLSEHVKLRTDYLSEEEVLSELSAADLVVYPYQQTQESASAAVRLGLASLTPVATTPLPIFDDVASITHRLPGTAAIDVAAGIRRLVTDSSELFRLAEQQKSWVAALQWQAISRRLYDLVRGEFLEDLLAAKATEIDSPQRGA